MVGGCIALGAAVVIPVIVWIVRDLGNAANVARVVSIPLAVISVLLGFVARPGERSVSSGDQVTPPVSGRWRDWAIGPRISRWLHSGHRRRWGRGIAASWWWIVL